MDNTEGRTSHEEKESVVVGEILPPEVHLLDQAPYTWAREDPSLIPIDFFTEENGWYIFCGVVLGYKGAGVGGDLRKSQDTYDYINSQKYDKSARMKIAEKLKSTLDSKYPFASKYVQDNKEFFTFDLDPKRPENEKGWKIKTYTAFAVEQQAGKWIGLAEELPDSYSTPEDVSEALPSKSRENKQYRLLKSIGYIK